MYTTLKALNKSEHKKLKIQPLESYKFAEKSNVAIIMSEEFLQVSANYPIVFIEDDGAFKPVALLGVEPGTNLFLDKKGKWDASYVPAVIRRYPFILAKGDDEENLTVCFDDDSKALNKRKGDPLFTDEEEPTERLEKINEFLVALHHSENIVLDQCKLLKQKNLFAPINLQFKNNEEIKNLKGVYTINHDLFKSLNDDDFKELREKDVLPLVYFHFASLEHLRELSIRYQSAENNAS